MILRRITEHVKAQNWTAVALDFVIVVVGILLAFQITEWSAARELRAQERVALLDLLGESVEIVRALQTMTASAADLLAAQDAAVAAVAAGDADAVDPQTLAQGLATLVFYPAISPPRDVYDGLAGAGDLDLIRDRGARRAVARYYSSLSFAQSQLDYWRAMTAQRYRTGHDGLRPVYDPQSPVRMDLEADFDLLTEDRAYVGELVGLLRNQFQFQRYRVALLDSAEEMCRELADVAGLDCPPLEAAD